MPVEKHIMEQGFALLMDLPDEIIMLILNKLDNVDVLYSLMNVNVRLDRILHDATFTTKIALVETIRYLKRLEEKLIHRFCFELLPKIHHQIQRLSVDSLSMERIFLAADYPNLYHLDIFIIDNDPRPSLTDELPLVDISQKNQIITLSVDGDLTYKNGLTVYHRGDLFSRILNMYTNILHLKFYQSTYSSRSFVKFSTHTPKFSSTLVELHINVQFFDDCLYLLDGRLNQLRRLFVSVHIISLPEPINDKRNEITQLKQFSLSNDYETSVYYDVIVPHLQRMTNLESLTLYLSVEEEKFIDGFNLTTNILSHMPHLNQFLFNIRSTVASDSQLHLPSTEHIQRSFRSCTDYEVVCYVDYFPSNKTGQCCVYTYPYTMLHYDGITNSFPGGLFKHVRYAQLFDERPFEHTFFLRISQAFPSLKWLSVRNFEPQICKDNQEKNGNHNRHLPIIEYPHLTGLQLFDIHDDYAEQFLLHTRTCFSNVIDLSIEYSTMQRVTHNFTRDATQVNCGKMKWLFIPRQLNVPEHFNLYFAHDE